MLLATVGNAVATGTRVLGARFFAMFLMPVEAVSAYHTIVAWVANSIPRPLVKRSATIAIANMSGNTATIYGSYMYPSSTVPQYVPGGSANAVVCLIVAAFALFLRSAHNHKNKKPEQTESGSGEAGVAEVPAARDQPPVWFRYIY